MTPQQSLSYQKLKSVWNRAESCGFESAWLIDHFIPYDFPRRAITEPVLECWMTLAALATDTKKIRLGPLVSCNSYRTPSLLAKMAASLDVISAGRLNFAIGAGWVKLEHDAYGYEFPDTSKRIERLREAIDIVRKMWTEEKATYNGKYFKIINAVNKPQPVQKPHPPICIGAEYEKMVKFAAEKADDWNFPSDINAYSTEDYTKRVQTLEAHCDLIGRKPESIKRSWLGMALLGSSEKQVDEKIAKVEPKSLNRQQFLREIVGTPSKCVQRIGEYVDLGVTEFILIFPEIERADCLKEFQNKVINEFA